MKNLNSNQNNPLLFQDKKIDVSKCVSELLKYGEYIYEPKKCQYFRFNEKFWESIDQAYFLKKLSLLIENLSCKQRNEIIDSLSIRISSNFLSNISSQKGLLNLKNGVLNIATGELEPHSKKYNFFNLIPIEYIPNDTCSVWLDFLDEILLKRPLLVKIIQDMFGYCLCSGNWLQTSFILIGDGENGKSTTLEVLRHILGINNTSSLSLNDINNRFRTVCLEHKLANISEESPSDKALASDVFKNIVSGGRLSVEQKFKSPYEFYNKAKMIFACNQTPIFKDHSHGFYRKLTIIPFDYRVPSEKKDPHLLELLLEELPGILNWALEGLHRITTYGKITLAHESEKAKELFIADSDSVKIFIDEMCEFEKGEKTLSHRAYDNYKEYCESNGYHPCSNNEFGKRLRRHAPDLEYVREGTPSSGNKRAYYWKGIKVFHD